MYYNSVNPRERNISLLIGQGSTRKIRTELLGIVGLLIIITCIPSLRSEALAYPLEHLDTTPSWVSCKDVLHTKAGLYREREARYIYPMLHKDQSEVKLILAVIYVESGFRTGAVSNKGAIGLMQLTDVAMRDLQRRGCRYNPKATLYDARYNVACGSCYLRSLYEETGNWTEALIVYNGGYRALTSYRKGSSVPKETAQFVLRVNHALQLCNN